MFSDFAEDLQTMPGLHYSVFVAVVSGLLLYLFYLIWRNLHRARIIEDTPTAKVRSAPQGYVELEGRARLLPEQPTVAPLTGTPCVWFRFKIEEERRGGHSGGSDWASLESGESETVFVFFDDTGDCLIDPRGADVTPGVKKIWYGSTRWPGGAQRRGLFGGLIGKRYRYTEERIDAGPVYVLGWFDTVRSTDASVSEEVATLLRDWKQDQDGLKQRFDRNRDGVIDESEWTVVRQHAHREVLQDRAVRSSQDEVHCVRASGHDRYPYLISAKPQFLLTGRYRRHAVFSLLGSVALTGFLAWMLVVRF